MLSLLTYFTVVDFSLQYFRNLAFMTLKSRKTCLIIMHFSIKREASGALWTYTLCWNSVHLGFTAASPQRGSQHQQASLQLVLTGTSESVFTLLKSDQDTDLLKLLIQRWKEMTPEDCPKPGPYADIICLPWAPSLA